MWGPPHLAACVHKRNSISVRRAIKIIDWQESIMNHENSEILRSDAQTQTALSSRVSSLALSSITPQTQTLLLRMFADPYILEKDDKTALVAQLRECVERFPKVSELRVLLGMALCVNL